MSDLYFYKCSSAQLVSSQKVMALYCSFASLRLCAFAPLRLIVFSADAPRHEIQLNAKEQRRKDAKEQYNAMVF